MWVVIAKILGIKLSPDEKPIVSAVLHIATFGSAAGDFYTLYLKFNKSRCITGCIDGRVSIIMISQGCLRAFEVYPFAVNIKNYNKF